VKILVVLIVERWDFHPADGAVQPSGRRVRIPWMLDDPEGSLVAFEAGDDPDVVWRRLGPVVGWEEPVVCPHTEAWLSGTRGACLCCGREGAALSWRVTFAPRLRQRFEYDRGR